MSPATGTWKDRSWAKRWMSRRSELERRQDPGEWINCDANCYCCRYLQDEGCVDTDDDANENCPNPGPTPPAAPAPPAQPTTAPPVSQTPPTTTLGGVSSPVPTTTLTPTNTPAGTTTTQASTANSAGTATTQASPTTPATATPQATASSTSGSQEWVFPVATASIRARQAGSIDTAPFGPVYREDSMIVQWTPEDSTPGIQWFCESNAGNRSGGLVASNQSQPLQIQFNNLADQADASDDVYCRLGFTDAPGQTVQWQYINTPNANGANVISAPANLATAAVATATSLISSATSTIRSSPTGSNENGSDGGGGGGLSTGAAAGIGVGVGIAAIIAIVLGLCFWRRRKNKSTHRSPAWASEGKGSPSSDDSSHPSYYNDNRALGDGVFELPGAPSNPTELPAGITGTAAMPSELYDHENKRTVAELYNPDNKRNVPELGSDKDFEEQQIRPRPLLPHPAQRLENEQEFTASSPSDYGDSATITDRSAVSPASGTMSPGDYGVVSPMTMRKQSQYSPINETPWPGQISDGSRLPRKPVRGGD